MTRCTGPRRIVCLAVLAAVALADPVYGQPATPGRGQPGRGQPGTPGRGQPGHRRKPAPPPAPPVEPIPEQPAAEPDATQPPATPAPGQRVKPPRGKQPRPKRKPKPKPKATPKEPTLEPLTVLPVEAPPPPPPPPPPSSPDTPADDGADKVESITEPSASASEPASTGDVVESIGASAPTPLVSSPAPLSADRFELHGWARQSVEVPLLAGGFHRATPDPLAVPYDRLVARSQLLASARYSRGRWFEADISGLLSYGFFEQGPSDGTALFTGVNGQATRGALEPQLRELYLAFFRKRLDVRIGQQRVAWGKADFISPNDVVNARDGRDPFVSETELRHIPTPMVRVDLDLSPITLQGVFSPVFIPDTFDIYGSNWAGVQPGAPGGVRGFMGLLSRAFDPSLQDLAQRLLQQTSLPSADLAHPSAGARMTWSLHNLDVSHYYHYGYDGPLITLDPGFAAILGSVDFAHAGLADLGPLYAAVDAGMQPFAATYVRRHHVGLDAATTLGPFALRLDAAYDSNRVFFRRDLLGATSAAVQSVLSIEYQTGDLDKLILVEGMYMRILDDPGAPLLIYDRDTTGAGALIRWKLWRPLSVELRGLVGIRPRTEVLQPQLNARWGSLTLTFGGLYLNGDDGSFGRYFRHNTEVYTKVKYTF